MDTFAVGAVVTLIDKFSSGFGALALGFAKSQTAADALNARMKLIQKTFNTGIVMVGGGLALAAPLIMATNKAVQLEEAMKRVQIATGASASEMSSFNRLLSKVSNETGVFSKPKLAEFAAHMREGGLLKMSDIQPLLEPFAKGADVMQLMSGGRITPEQTAHTFTAIAHQQGIYDPKKMMPIVDAAVALAPATPGGVETFKKWGTALVGIRNLNMAAIDQMALISALTQTSGTGGTGKAGITASNLANVFARALPGNFGSGLLAGKSAFALHAMGLSDASGVSTVMKNNKLDLPLMMEKLKQVNELASTASGRVELAQRIKAQEKFLGKKAGDIDPLLEKTIKSGGMSTSGAQLIAMLNQYAFGSAKGVATLLSDPKFRGQYEKVKGLAANSAGETERQQKALSSTTKFQKIRAATNMETLMSTFGMAMLPVMKKVLIYIADTTDKLNQFAEQHPRVVKAITGMIGALSGMLIIGGIGKMLQAAFMGLKFVFGPLAGAVNWMVKGLSPLLPIMGRLWPLISKAVPVIGAITLAVTALILVIQNWGKITKFVADHQAFFNHIGAETGRIAQLVATKMSELGGALMGLLGQLGAGIAKLPFMGDIAKKIADWQQQAFKGPDAAQQKKDQADMQKFYGGQFGSNPNAPFNPAANPTATARTNGAAGAKPTVINNTNNVHPGAIVVNGAHDPKKTADEVMRKLNNGLRQMGAATTSAGGVSTTKYAYGATH